MSSPDGDASTLADALERILRGDGPPAASDGGSNGKGAAGEVETTDQAAGEASRIELPNIESVALVPGTDTADVAHAADDSDDDPWRAGRDDEPFVLPEIVPATVDDEDATPAAAPATAEPALPTAAAALSDSASPIAAPVAAVREATVPVTTLPVTAWGDHMPISVAPQGERLRAPGRRPRVRRVTRVVRHVDPWSTFKVALLFSLVGYVVALTSGVLLWRVAESTGTIDNVERWFTQFGWQTFELKGGEIFHNAWIIGLFAAVGFTGLAVLLATLFNLVSDIVGGIRVTVLEEEVVERTASSARRYVVRRVPSGSSTWSVDGDDQPAATTSVPSVSTAHAPAVVSAPSKSLSDWSVDDDEPLTAR